MHHPSCAGLGRFGHARACRGTRAGFVSQASDPFDRLRTGRNPSGAGVEQLLPNLNPAFAMGSRSGTERGAGTERTGDTRFSGGASCALAPTVSTPIATGAAKPSADTPHPLRVSSHLVASQDAHLRHALQSTGFGGSHARDSIPGRFNLAQLPPFGHLITAHTL